MHPLAGRSAQRERRLVPRRPRGESMRPMAAAAHVAAWQLLEECRAGAHGAAEHRRSRQRVHATRRARAAAAQPREPAAAPAAARARQGQRARLRAIVERAPPQSRQPGGVRSGARSALRRRSVGAGDGAAVGRPRWTRPRLSLVARQRGRAAPQRARQLRERAREPFNSAEHLGASSARAPAARARAVNEHDRPLPLRLFVQLTPEARAPPRSQPPSRALTPRVEPRALAGDGRAPRARPVPCASGA